MCVRSAFQMSAELSGTHFRVYERGKKMRFEVGIEVRGYVIYNVNAESEEEAIDKAENEFACANLGSLEYANDRTYYVKEENGKTKYLY